MNAPRKEVLAEGVEIWLGDCQPDMFVETPHPIAKQEAFL